MAIRRDITGLRSGKLTAVKFYGKSPPPYLASLWLCQCDCGRQSIVSASDFYRQKIKSCGCRLPKPAITKPARPGRFTHGHRGTKGSSKTPTYYSWACMRTRCTNPKDPGWHLYGGAGVKCCERWKKFANFLADMGECPQGMTLDRFPDPAGNYEPENCRWATPVQQSRNTKKNARKNPEQLFLKF